MGIISGLLFVLVVIIVFKSMVSVSPNERWIKERLSQYAETLDAGWHFLIPLIDSVRKVDMREKVFNTWSSEMITKDNAVVTVDAVVYMQIVDPRNAVYAIDNPYSAVLQIAMANLRSMIWQLTLDECLSERSRINAFVQTHLSDETAKWWVKVTKVEIQKIDPPADLIHSMQEQKKAEQEKRAQILRAEWLREAAIREAEWTKQSEILRAEWEKQKQIIEAEWQAQAIERIAAAKAKALELESTAAISFFKDNAITKEQLRVVEESLKSNSKYILDTDIFNWVRNLLGK